MTVSTPTPSSVSRKLFTHLDARGSRKGRDRIAVHSLRAALTAVDSPLVSTLPAGDNGPTAIIFYGGAVIIPSWREIVAKLYPDNDVWAGKIKFPYGRGKAREVRVVQAVFVGAPGSYKASLG